MQTNMFEDEEYPISESQDIFDELDLNGIVGPPTASLWGFQKQATDLVQTRWREGFNHPLLVSPTGSGKTICAAKATRDLVDQGASVLVTADRLILLYQFQKVFRESFGIDPGLIIAGESQRPRSRVQIASRDTFLSRHLTDDGRLKHKMGIGNFDHLIFDEAHRSTNRSFMAMRKVWPAAKCLGLTATPMQSSGKPLGFPYYDCIIEAAKPSQLLASGHILPAIVFRPSTPELERLAKTRPGSDYRKEELFRLMRSDNMVGDAAGHWKRLASGRPTIVFCVNRKHAKYVADIYNSHQNRKLGIQAAYIDCDTPREKRREIFELSRAGVITHLVNADLLTEGVDLPWISCVQILKPSKSLRLVLQLFGRGMRRHTYPNGFVKKDWILLDHSGVVMAHCLPGTDIDWNLGSGRMEDQVKQAKINNTIPKPKECPICKCTHNPAPKCPYCGHEYHTIVKPQKIDMRHGELRLHEGSAPKEHRAVDIQKLRQAAWHKSINTAIKKGLSAGVAAQMFKTACGLMPWEAGVHPLPDRSEWKKPAKYAFPNLGKRGFDFEKQSPAGY